MELALLIGTDATTPFVQVGLKSLVRAFCLPEAQALCADRTTHGAGAGSSLIVFSDL